MPSEMVQRRTAPPLVLVLVLVLVLGASVNVARGAILNDFIRHYELIEYDASALAAQHRRVRRSIEPSPDVQLRFRTGARDFRLRLQPDRSLFTPDVVFESDTGPVQFDTNSVYKGVLEDDEGSVVHGVIGTDGLFDGSVVTASEHYFIEPA
ncbi:Disintegrin and metalloproteinase domain-containing protein 10 [Amphibalanus amphitrite]|uniref:Disintegrin and metalloproteinase domain-containing protein 10 n=1 Tax=Amphibalanus amphitrite TaxID=1232801 RepID=A0A6A4XB49_AMPAM|nr:Disintegrin and metalloproteinase domain-containing protein 10 [Amphibalanus amphitrite]KAF0313194.1 Disintegrin and metalloproteinase domain-containing protein 10 [Amphibalanus amphitrite]